MPKTGRASLDLCPLERFIGNEWLDRNAWTFTDTGTIMDGRHPITPPGFVPAMKAVLNSLYDLNLMTVAAVTPPLNLMPTVATSEVEIPPHRTRVSHNLPLLERFVGNKWLDLNAWTVTDDGTIMDGGTSNHAARVYLRYEGRARCPSRKMTPLR